MVVVVLAVGVSRVPPSGRTVIRYCQWSGVWNQPVVWEIKKAFEKENPDIEVKLEFYPRAYDYWQKLYTMIAADVAPDVWFLLAPPMIEQACKGILEDLTPLIERDGLDMSQYYEMVSDSFKFHDRQFGLAVQFGSIALYYNLDLFDRAGLAYPNMKWEPVIDEVTAKPVIDPKTGTPRRQMIASDWNWDDLLKAAKALTVDLDDDGMPDQFGFLVANNMQICIANFVYQNGGRIMDDQRTTVLIDSDEAIDAIQFLQDLKWKLISVSNRK